MRAVIFFLLLVLPTASQATSCDSAAHRAFDFWLGNWQVYKPDGSIAGKNRVQQAHNGCVITEQYSTASGFSGQSINIYDKQRKLWHQSWADSSGSLLLLEGKALDDGMALSGSSLQADGSELRHQIRWTALPDGTVRQLWQTKSQTTEWQTVFDGHYRKLPEQ